MLVYYVILKSRFENIAHTEIFILCYVFKQDFVRAGPSSSKFFADPMIFLYLNFFQTRIFFEFFLETKFI